MIGEHLRQLRVARDMTQQQVAEVLGVTDATVSAWENERLAVAEKHWAAIKKLFPQWNPRFVGGYRLSAHEKAEVIRLARRLGYHQAVARLDPEAVVVEKSRAALEAARAQEKQESELGGRGP